MNLNTDLDDFFHAYKQEQILLAQHLSAQTELERKTKALYLSLTKHFDEMPNKLIVDSPYGQMLLTFDNYGGSVRKIELIDSLKARESKP